MGKIYVFDHPLIQHKVSQIRNKETSTKDFRQIVKEIAMLMTFESSRDLPLKEVEIETPICKTTVNVLEGEDVAVVPILRAGLGMVDGVTALIACAMWGFTEILKPTNLLNTTAKCRRTSIRERFS